MLNAQQPAGGAGTTGPEEKVLPSGKRYTVEALNKAFSEVKMEASLAQLFFVPWWEEALSLYGGDVPMQKVEAGIDKCFRMSEIFRKKLHVVEFEKRETYDKAEREKYQKAGKTIIHLPDAGEVAPHVPGGYIQGLE